MQRHPILDPQEEGESPCLPLLLIARAGVRLCSLLCYLSVQESGLWDLDHLSTSHLIILLEIRDGLSCSL